MLVHRDPGLRRLDAGGLEVELLDVRHAARGEQHFLGAPLVRLLAWSRGAIVATTSSPSCRTRWTKTFVASSIPSACSAAASVAEASASASGAIRSAASTIRTWAPKRENA